MKKIPKKWIILCIFIIVLIIMYVATKFASTESKLEPYLNEIGFTKEEDSTLFYKQISNIPLETHEQNIENNIESTYEALYFNINDYTLTKDKQEFYSGINTSFNPTYDYKDKSLNYTYRINLNSTNVILEGTYDYVSKTFTCEPLYAYDINIDNATKDICEKINIDVEDFYNEAYTLITNTSILKDIENK